jgi:uncharacterized membrane protein
MGVTGSFYKILLVLHIACAIAGFGGLAWNGLYLVLARRRGGQAEGGALDVNAEVSRIAEFLIYAVFILGILVVATSKSAWKFSQGWLSAAMVMYIVALGIYHGFIKRTQREYRQVIGRLSAAAPPAGPQVSQLEQLEQRINLGWGAFDVVVLVIVWLMVAKPH